MTLEEVEANIGKIVAWRPSSDTTYLLTLEQQSPFNPEWVILRDYAFSFPDPKLEAMDRTGELPLEEVVTISHDSVNHPSHYKKGTVECIDAIESSVAGLEGAEAVLTGNIIKYIFRWKWKGGIEDLKKAKWYLERLIEKLTSLA